MEPAVKYAPLLYAWPVSYVGRNSEIWKLFGRDCQDLGGSTVYQTSKCVLSSLHSIIGYF